MTSKDQDGQLAAEDGSVLVGVPDGFERLWTPHRMVYIDAPKPAAEESVKAECPFCIAPTKSDGEGLIVHRGKHCFTVMNLYPYNAGHLLVCPYRHVADYTELSDSERVELGELTARAMEVLRAVAGPQGFNLGMNQGAVAGAGIAAHLHQHVVPRWAGDSNFFPIIAQTKAMPQLLEETRLALSDSWPLMAASNAPVNEVS